VIVFSPLTFGTLPYDSVFVSNDIPKNMQPCSSYNVKLTVKNTGTRNWSTQNGVFLLALSHDGFTFDPTRNPIPEGVVVKPGGSYTFPLTINVPCPMKNGTYKLNFRLLYTLPNGDEIPFGQVLNANVSIANPTANVASSGQKGLVKSPLSGTITASNPTTFSTRDYPETGTTGTGRQFINTIPQKPVISQVSLYPATMMQPDVQKKPSLLAQAVTSSQLQANKTLSSRFPLISTLMWVGILQDQ